MMFIVRIVGKKREHTLTELTEMEEKHKNLSQTFQKQLQI